MARQADLGTASLRAWLQKQTKAELVALVTSLAGSHEEVRRSLMDRRAPGSGRGQAIIQSIAGVNVRGYEAAEPCLRQMKSAFTQAGRRQEWEEYLASLRERNRRRPRCLEVLDRVEG